MDTTRKTQIVKYLAREAGFDFCGVAQAGYLEDEAPRLEAWLRRGYHGEMHYMEKLFDLRLDPRKLVPGARSVICLAMNYYPEPRPSHPEGLKISRYAYGEDYHKVLRKAMKTMVHEMKRQLGDFSFRVFTDSGPVMEKVWAARAGVGWMGKHSNLIIKKAGSYFFLGEIICDVELEYDAPAHDHCGTCTRCMEACPTEAIPRPYEVDGSKCISYFTIELKSHIPESVQNTWNDWIFGCDICQEVCPWNRFSIPHNRPEFEPQEKILNKTVREWFEITEELFEEQAARSPLKRAGLNKIRNNIRFLKKSLGSNASENFNFFNPPSSLNKRFKKV